MKNIRIYLNNEVIEGLLITEDEKYITIKLSNGYNIGISKRKINRIEHVSEIEEERINEINNTVVLKQRKDLPKIIILHTGGTIASKVDYKTGAVNAKFEPEELLEMFPELRDLANIESELISNMMSDDMRFIHYNIIAERVKEKIKQHSPKGIIITHGTDTMHYTSAALSFIFEHLPIPVILVGSQRSSDRGSSDSSINLISAVSFAVNTSLSGVFICMHENISDESCVILNGLNARKMHSSRRDAFQSINSNPIARINFFDKKIEYLNEYPNSPLNSPGKLVLHPFKDLKIGIVVSHPNMCHEELECFINSDFDGLIIEGTGLGHVPISVIDEHTKEHEKIKNSIKKLCNKMPVVMTTQTIFGTINLNVYSPGRQLQEIGVIGNLSSLSIETAFIKLGWLISQGLDPKVYFMKNIRGEFLISK
ncbi:MAG: glutamyl-tRNA(Gln) amidotransferase subunit D [Candidatus Woesearchaeota archaeon]|nr:MAG: glutamyl-tRNA(Gln) amidotransferase subunit D [Candidatus Woesearchaeota archaeon]